ncbi:hypothetical protein N9H75_04505 [Amylibacter sp.]|nr:hypothetical protein [Amylibacter sp.]
MDQDFTNLDKIAGKYMMDPTEEIENAHIMDWHSFQIFKHKSKVPSLLELDNAYNEDYFSTVTDNHHIVEAVPSVIKHFKTKNLSFMGTVHMGFMQTLDDLQSNLIVVLKVGLSFPDLCIAILFKLILPKSA